VVAFVFVGDGRALKACMSRDADMTVLVSTNLIINSACVTLYVYESHLLFLIYKVGWKYTQDNN